MASSKDYLDYVLKQLSSLESIHYRPMMKEYLIYYNDRLIGGIYDNRFLIKETKNAKLIWPELTYQIPYEGAKKMLWIKELDDSVRLTKFILDIFNELPESKRSKKHVI